MISPRPSPTLSQLPAELLLIIGSMLPVFLGLHSLCCTSRRLYAIFHVELYRAAIGDPMSHRRDLFGSVRSFLHHAVNTNYHYRHLERLFAIDRNSTNQQTTALLNAFNRLDSLGRTPLHTAALLGDYRAIKLLLLHGANIEATDKDGYTALHYAASRRSPRAAIALLDAGAQRNPVGGLNLTTPLDISLLLGRRFLVCTLQSEGCIKGELFDVTRKTFVKWEWRQRRREELVDQRRKNPVWI